MPYASLLERSPDRVRRLGSRVGKAGERLEELRRLAQQRPASMRATADARDARPARRRRRHQGDRRRDRRAHERSGDRSSRWRSRRGRDRRCCWCSTACQDPHNLGACLRTADAARVTAVIVPRDRASRPDTRGAQGGGGRGGERAVHRRRQSRADAARTQGARASGSSARATRPRRTLYDVDFTGPRRSSWAEGEGMRRLTREACDTLVAIPMGGHRREPQRLGGRGRRALRSGPPAAWRRRAPSRPNCAPAAARLECAAPVLPQRRRIFT